MSQPDLIDYINDHLGVDFDTLQVKVAFRNKDQAILQDKHHHFSLASVSHPQAVLQPIQEMYAALCWMTTQWAVVH
jgi:hypothetical protein